MRWPRINFDPLTSWCPKLAKNEFLMRQHTAGAHFTLFNMLSTRHRKVRNDRNILCVAANTHTHTHTPKPVCIHDIVLLLRTWGIHTNKKVTVNMPGVIIKSKNKKYLHGNRCGNISVLEWHARRIKEKKHKIKRLWSIKCMIIPVIIRTTGIVEKV